MTASMPECIACQEAEAELRRVIRIEETRYAKGDVVRRYLIALAKAARDQAVRECSHPALKRAS